jgi:hypothetical protein
MEPAGKLQYERRDSGVDAEKAVQKDQHIQDWEQKVGKSIFYITVATAIWFFYWFNGIQCPC